MAARVLFLLEDLCYGGTQAQTLELAARLDRAKFSPHILTLTGPTDLDSRAQAAGIPVTHMASGRQVAPFFFLKLGRALAAHNPDIIVPCTALPNIWGRIWGKLKRGPIVVGTCRGGGAPGRQHEKWLWRLCDGIICNSRPLVRMLKNAGVPDAVLTYIPNGVDMQRFRPSRKKFGCEAALIVCVARLAKDKNHKTLLRAFDILAASYPEVRLRLVGEGPEEKVLRKFVERELSPEAAGRVEFAGASARPEEHYAEADIFALASDREGQPNAVLEAMSSALPICATDAGAIPDMLSGVGLVSQPGDAQGLADNLLTYIRAPRMAVHMGALARAKVEAEYSYEVMTMAHEKLFLDLLQGWRKKNA
ncbi:MAG: glycosyltransferase family 4 protein [Desulfovibrio sp.]|nr:glycosyltransferase family 4 protein [Desulfovibrio sp.]